MSNITVDKFLECVRRSELVTEDRLAPALASLKESTPAVFDEADQLAKKLIELKLLTQWQAEKLLEGKSSSFRLGPYKLMRLLGAGGMSTVFLAEHTLMQCLRAIKVLPASRVNDSSYLQRFRQEAIAASRLNHPNIVQTYDISQHKIHHYIVMEYVEGRDLQNVVKESGLPDYVTVANYIRQAADGLGYAHQSGLIHRDIKPANFLVDKRGVVKLLDLGLARIVDDLAPSLTIAHDENVLGTADYLAPEQAIYSHGVDHRADIYSLGCTMYYLLTGHPPFPHGSLQQRIHSHQNKSPASIYEERPDAPQALVDVCERMMCKSPEGRYQQASDVSAALKSWLAAQSQGAGGGAGPRGSGGRPLPPPRRKSSTLTPPRPNAPGSDSDTIADMDRETTIKGSPNSRPQPAIGSGQKSDSQLSGSGKQGSQSDKLRTAQRGPGDSKGGSSKGGNNGLGAVGRDPRKSGPQATVSGSGPIPFPGEIVGSGSGKMTIPKAQSLDSALEDDPTSVLFGASEIGGGAARGILEQRIHRRPKPVVSIPKWLWLVMGGVFLLAVVVIVIAIFSQSKPAADTPRTPDHIDRDSIKTSRK